MVNKLQTLDENVSLYHDQINLGAFVSTLFSVRGFEDFWVIHPLKKKSWMCLIQGFISVSGLSGSVGKDCYQRLYPEALAAVGQSV